MAKAVTRRSHLRRKKGDALFPFVNQSCRICKMHFEFDMRCFCLKYFASVNAHGWFLDTHKSRSVLSIRAALF